MQSAFILITLVFLATSEAIFQCNRTSRCESRTTASPQQTTTTNPYNILPALRPTIDLEPLTSLEGVCVDICNNCNGPSTTKKPQDFIDGALDGLLNGGDKNAHGFLGDLLKGSPAECLADSGVAITRTQACVFTCILRLNVLDICEVDVLVSKLEAICPNLETRALCVDACACCGDNDAPLDVCVELCLTHTNGSNNNVQLPIFGTPIPANVLPQDILFKGLPGVGLDVVGISAHKDDHHNGKGKDNGNGQSGSASGNDNGGPSGQGLPGGANAGSAANAVAGAGSLTGNLPAVGNVVGGVADAAESVLSGLGLGGKKW